MKVDKNINSKRSNWRFDKSVVKSFDEHISKSVPFYKITHDIIVKLSDFFLKDNSLCYDLGCSNGTLLKEIALRQKKNNIKFIGYDISKDMIIEAKKKEIKNLNFYQKDIIKIPLKKSDMIICVYILQFVQPKFRQVLINKIFKSLNWGGVLVLVEKIRGNDARFQDILTFLHHDYKKRKGFKTDEIYNKEISLRSVLEPYSIKANMDFMKRAGFEDIMPFFQYLCFKGFFAVK